MKPTALLLNLFVAGISFYYYYKEGYFNKKLFLSFAITSIPLAFIGGTIEIDASIYKKILAILLVFAILKMLNVFGKETENIKEVKLWQGLLVGGIIGFFSGLIGIGGGIILTPLILLLHWGNMKEAAAVSALFIWVNSAAGLVGQVSSGIQIEIESFIISGHRFNWRSSRRLFWKQKMERYKYYDICLAFVLIIACVKLFFT